MRPKASLLVLCALALLVPAVAHAASVGWVDEFGTSESEVAWGVAVQGTDVYVDGWTSGELPGQTSAGLADGYVRRVDATGNEVWTRQFGTSEDDFIVALAVDATGVYAAGSTSGTLPGQTKVGGSDAILVKYDLDGNELWTVQFGTDSADFPSNVVVDATGVYVVGNTYGTFPGQTNRGDADVFLTRFDAAGTQDWTVEFGSRRWDTGYANALGPAGVFVDGFTGGGLPGQRDRGDLDAFVGLFTTGGDRIWLKQFGTREADFGFGIVADATGVWVSGDTYGSLGGQESRGTPDAFVRGFAASDGSVLWTKQFGTREYDGSYGLAVLGTEVYAVGATDGRFPGQTDLGRSDAFVRAFDAVTGTTAWTLQFGTGKFDAANWAWAANGALYVSGVTEGTFSGQTNEGGSDAFAARIDLTT
jgi:hypothetical protein